MLVTKRDGRKEEFNSEKIVNAVIKAFIAVDGKVTPTANNISKGIALTIENENKDFDIEEIQDMVEDNLMSTNRKDVARAYILYREKRTRTRDMNNDLIKTAKEKLAAINVQNQNANVDERSFGGRMGEATDVLLKKIALDFCVSDMSRYNHENNMIYIHDLSHYVLGDHNCLSIPFDDLLANGFKVRQTDVRPAQSVNTAFQLIAVITQVQSLCQFGGASATHLDHTMVPYVRKSFMKHYLANYAKGLDSFSSLDILYSDMDELDDWFVKNKEEYLQKTGLSIEDFNFSNIDKKDTRLNKLLAKQALYDTRKEIYQAVEGMYHNLNTLQSRSGNQLPFSSINYGTCTVLEGQLVTKALLDISLKGIGSLHRTSIFPCGIFQYMKGVNNKPGTPNYYLFRRALESTAKRLYPNYANVDWSGNAGYDINDPRTYFSTMGCRTANGFDINGFGQLKDGRGNVCPVTIILPTIAMMAKEKSSNSNSEDLIKNFFELLDTKIHEAKDMLIERFDWICSQDSSSARFMYENNTMAGYIPEEGIRSALKHGTLSLGQLGLAECLQILIECDHTTKKGMDLAKEIEGLFKKRCAEFKNEYKLNFGVYYTPAENLCYTAMKKFKEKYGIIKNVSENDYFTNSIHVPVWSNLNPFEKIDIESELTGYSSAGCITYVELETSVRNNIDALETLVNYAMEKDIPYFAINVPSDTCMDCGYNDEITDNCPVCGSNDIQRLKRVTGYLTGDYKEAFNLGKQQETDMRFKHTRITRKLEGDC